MCLAVPMEIRQIDGDTAFAELDGNRHAVNLALLDEAAVGDYVIVHAGFAIQRLDREEADARIALFNELAEARRAALS